jgi:histidyl-tRNA synthetase
LDREDKLRAIAGGGRYDNLVEIFGGQSEPATGFAIGDKVLKILLEEKGKLPQVSPGPDYYVIGIGDVDDELKDLITKLREKYSVDFDIQGRKLGKQFDYANSIGAKKVIVVGPQELEQGKVKIKDMSSGEETLVDINKI